MKRLILALLVLTGLSGCMTIKTPDMSMVSNAIHEQVIDVPGKSRSQIFEQSKQWIALNFVSAKKVIEYDNAAEGKIIGNSSAVVYFNTEGSMMGKMSYPQTVPFIMVEDIKDGKARIVFNGGAEMPVYAWEQMKPKFVNMGSGLQSYLAAPTEVKNW